MSYFTRLTQIPARPYVIRKSVSNETCSISRETSYDDYRIYLGAAFWGGAQDAPLGTKQILFGTLSRIMYSLGNSCVGRLNLNTLYIVKLQWNNDTILIYFFIRIYKKNYVVATKSLYLGFALKLNSTLIPSCY